MVLLGVEQNTGPDQATIFPMTATERTDATFETESGGVTTENTDQDKE